MITIKGIKKDQSIQFNSGQEDLQDLFIKSIPEGSKVLVTYEVVTDDHSYEQIAKVHKCIRELAKETGEDFEAMKLALKKELGLYEPGTKDFKSFSNYSKVELSEAIRVIISWGDVAGINLSSFQD